MKSKTCCFNKTLVRKDFFRGFPLWLLWLLGWLTAMPLYVLNASYRETAMDFTRYILELASASTHILPMLYGAAVAFLLFGYQYASRSANFFGALPLRRESLFATKYLTGLCYCVLPNLLTGLLTVAVGAGKGMNLAAPTATWLAVSCLMYFFYFSFACVCAMMVGHMVAMPVVYGLLLFAAVILEQITRGLMETFVYGFTARGDLVTIWLSPVVKCLNSVGVDAHWNGDQITAIDFDGWNVVLTYAAVGVFLLAVAFFFHKYRRMESAGDVIAVRHLKPLYLYGFTFSCAITLGYVLSAILFDGMRYVGVVRTGSCMVFAAVIGYFGGEMLLHKSLRVFCKRTWANCAVACVLLVAMLGCLRLDLFNIAGRVPQAEDVESVSFEYAGMFRVRDEALIQSVIDVHQEIVDRQRETEAMIRDGDHYYPSIRLTYYLTDGGSLTREYRLPVTTQTVADPDSLVNLYDKMYNDPNMVVARELPAGLTARQITHATINAYEYIDGEDQWFLTAKQTMDLLERGIIPDMRNGHIGVSRLSDNLPREQAVEPDTVATENRELYLALEFHPEADNSGYGYCHVTISQEARQTLKVLAEYGIPAEIFENQ